MNIAVFPPWSGWCTKAYESIEILIWLAAWVSTPRSGCDRLFRGVKAVSAAHVLTSSLTCGKGRLVKMVDDIFKVDVLFELPTGSASIGMFYVQTVDHTPLGEEHDSRVLAEAWRDASMAALRDCLADDVRAPVVRARHVYRENDDNVFITHELDIQPSAGTIAGPSHPNNLAWLVSMSQNVFPKKTKGKFFMPGIPESQTDGNLLTAAFSNGAQQAFISSLAFSLSHVSDGGTFVLSVRSWKVFYAPVQDWKDGGEAGPRPEPDWAGAMAPATAISGKAGISPMKQRATKVRGAAA